METDFKTKEHAEEAILNTKKDFVKRQAELKVQMEELEEKVSHALMIDFWLISD